VMAAYFSRSRSAIVILTYSREQQEKSLTRNKNSSAMKATMIHGSQHLSPSTDFRHNAYLNITKYYTKKAEMKAC
jgi:hypothetical protein